MARSRALGLSSVMGLANVALAIILSGSSQAPRARDGRSRGVADHRSGYRPDRPKDYSPGQSPERRLTYLSASARRR
jgi:hypothetical protein